MAQPSVSEKTLELNICEELLLDVRKEHPKAFWYGPSTREEYDLGYDASLRGTHGVALFLQFKRTSYYPATRPKSYPYWFRVDSRQHNVLYELAKEHPGCVKYAFPLLGDLEEVTEAVPKLDSETVYSVLDEVGPLEESARQHKVEVYRDKVIFHSEPRMVKAHRGTKISEDIRLAVRGQRLLTLSQFTHSYEHLIRSAFTTLINQYAFVIESRIPRAMFVPV